MTRHEKQVPTSEAAQDKLHRAVRAHQSAQFLGRTVDESDLEWERYVARDLMALVVGLIALGPVLYHAGVAASAIIGLVR